MAFSHKIRWSQLDCENVLKRTGTLTQLEIIVNMEFLLKSSAIGRDC
jgi:hypothetical protein